MAFQPVNTDELSNGQKRKLKWLRRLVTFTVFGAWIGVCTGIAIFVLFVIAAR